MRIGALALVALGIFGCDGTRDRTAVDEDAVDAFRFDADPPPSDAGASDTQAADGAEPEPPVDADVDVRVDLGSPPDRGVEIDARVQFDASMPADAARPIDAAPPVDAEIVDAAIVDLAVDAAVVDPPDAWLPPGACDGPTVLPVEATVQLELDHRFAAGGMAFDAIGRVAVIDELGDLYQLDTDGGQALWAEAVAHTPRGLAFLASGALVVADSGRGMLQLVYTRGEVRTLVDHMDAPYGLVVDRDDFIYVAEATRGGITRVDPDSGRIQRLADGLPFAPQALALSPDEQTLYISARQSGVVYAIDRDARGDFGEIRVHARLPEAGGGALGVCGDGRRTLGEQCDDGNAVPRDGCAGDCSFDPYNGAVDAADGIYDFEFSAGGRAEVVFTIDSPGDVDRFAFSLAERGPVGIYTSNFSRNGCNGDTWVTLFRAGEDEPIAENDDDPTGAFGTCSRISPDDTDAVADLPPGDYEITVRHFAAGETELAGNWLTVQRLMPPGIGDGCDADGLPCPEGSFCGDVDGDQVCVEHVCGDGVVSEDEACDDGNPIRDDGCSPECTYEPYNRDVDAEDGIYPLVLGEAGTARVIFTTDVPGDIDRFGFTLEAPTDLEILTTDLEGDGCNGDTFVDLYRAGEARPMATNDDDPTRVRRLCSLLRAEENPVMHALPAGDYIISIRQYSGRTTELIGNWLIVRHAGAPDPVEHGVDPCAGRIQGAACRREDGLVGTCDVVGRQLQCVLPPVEEDPCEAADEACATGGEAGVCTLAPDGFFCFVGPACGQETLGEACQSTRTQGPGRCTRRDGGAYVCQPAAPCKDLAVGDPCRVRRLIGTCRDDDRGGVTYCDVGAGGADITALETDACGHIYAGDGPSQTVWRIDPDGEDVTRFAALHRGAITGLAFDPNGQTLWIGGQGGADLLSTRVGLPGRPMLRPQREVVPDTPEHPETWRCLDVPSAPLEITELNRPRGYHDVAFDDEGFVIGFDGTALVRVNRQDQLQPYALGLRSVEGLDFLPDGSLLALSGSGLVRIAPNGAQEVLAADVHGYGVTVGPDGRAYVGNNQNRVWRVDPVTGLVEPFLDTRELAVGFAPRNIAFDLDASLMYIGTFGPEIYVLTLDERLDPVGEPRYFATVQPNVRWVDGLTVDRCGQLYAPNFETATLNRSSPDGDMRLYHQWASSQYGHNVVWGSGIGGWRTDALYLPQPYDRSTVVEVVVGVEGAVLAPVAVGL